MQEWIWFGAGVFAMAIVALVLQQRRRRAAAAVSAAVAERRARAMGAVEALVRQYRARIAEFESLVRRRQQELASAPRPESSASKRSAPATDPPAAVATSPKPAAAESVPVVEALGLELASIVSGIEGATCLHIEASPLPPKRSPTASALWLAVRRLRRFYDKVAAFAAAPAGRLEPAPIDTLLLGLREELEASELGLQMSLSLPRTLPRLRAGQGDLLSALLFVTQALRQIEPGALRLSLHVEPRFEERPPMLELELQLEYDEDPGRSPEPTPATAAFQVARIAAENMLRGHAATLAIDHRPGDSARALVRLPVDAATADPVPAGLASQAPAPLPATAPAARHTFGGVLVLESDPSVRSMVASALKESGRAVFACADGAAARSLMQATPDRFEMLVIDQASRLGAGDALATTASRLCPRMKVLVLSDANAPGVPPEIAARVHSISKPFGPHELRRALAEALAG